MTTYRWDSVHEWLVEKIEEWRLGRCRAELKVLIAKLDQDVLQDEYQDLMSEDGYFEPLKETKP